MVNKLTWLWDDWLSGTIPIKRLELRLIVDAVDPNELMQLRNVIRGKIYRQMILIA